MRRKIGARRRASNAKDARWANATIPARLAKRKKKKKKRPQWDSNHPLQVYDCARGIVEKRPSPCLSSYKHACIWCSTLYILSAEKSKAENEMQGQNARAGGKASKEVTAGSVSSQIEC